MDAHQCLMYIGYHVISRPCFSLVMQLINLGASGAMGTNSGIGDCHGISEGNSGCGAERCGVRVFIFRTKSRVRNDHGTRIENEAIGQLAMEGRVRVCR